MATEEISFFISVSYWWLHNSYRKTEIFSTISTVLLNLDGLRTTQKKEQTLTHYTLNDTEGWLLFFWSCSEKLKAFFPLETNLFDV